MINGDPKCLFVLAKYIYILNNFKIVSAVSASKGTAKIDELENQ